MPDLPDNYYDIIVAGGGFAGSITALILDQLNFKVCLIEKGKHPRFAIGESSTPVADLLLRELSSKYNLPWLRDFSRYGSWQATHPDIICGIKRGFSFFKHYPGKEFSTDTNHTLSLIHILKHVVQLPCSKGMGQHRHPARNRYRNWTLPGRTRDTS